MLEGMKASFAKMLAELAYEALARPIVLSVLGGVGGTMGLSSAATGSILGTGNNLSLGNLSSISNLFGSGTGGITSAINGFGAKIGFGGYGPGMSSFTSSTLSSVLGAAGIGAGVGGLLASLTGGNQLGGSIGGGLGAGIGMTFGPVGALVGGGLGSLLGGMLGGGIKRDTLGATIRANSDGLISYSANSSKDGAAQWGKTIATSLNTIVQALGATFSTGLSLGSVETNIGEKDRKTVIGHSKVLSKNPNDINAILRYVFGNEKAVVGENADLLGVVQKSLKMGSGASQVVSDIGLAKSILGIDDDTERAIAEVNKQFDTMYDRAVKLGLPLEKINEALDKQRDAAIGAVKAMEAGFSSLEEMTSSFKSFLDSQALGSSSLSPMAKLALAQGNYDELLGKAQGGDASVTKDLLAAAATVLDVGRSVFASSKSFADLEGLIRTDIKEIAHSLGVPGYASGTASAASGLAWVGEKGPELVRFRGGEQVYTASQSADIARETGRLQIEMVALMRELVEINSRSDSKLASLNKARQMEQARQKVTAR